MNARSSRPNILFLFSDQQRWDTCGCYGQPLNVTPNLDRMARDGVRFERAFTCQPVCGPARACLQTGLWATETGCFRNGIALPPGQRTIAHELANAGYAVGYIGKWHLASTRGLAGTPDANYETRPVPPRRRGGYRDYWLASDVLEFTSHSYDGHMFDGRMKRREFPKGRYRVDVLTDWVLEFLRSRRRGRKPFFLFVSYIEPHHQNDHRRYEGPRGSKTRFKRFVVPGDLAGTGGDWRREYPDYLGCIHSLDANVGRIRAELAALGLADDTVVLYTSDHGSHFCTRNSEYKRSCHDGCVRVPLLACGPGFAGGRVVRELVSLIDLPPTVLAAGGVRPPRRMRGRPLQPLVEGRAEGWPGDVFIQISEDHIGRAVRTERWKYEIRVPSREPWSGWRQPGGLVYQEACLYDLRNDPHERRNLVNVSALKAVRVRLAGLIERRMAEAGEEVPAILPA